MIVIGWISFALVLAGLSHYSLWPDHHWTLAGWSRLGLFAAVSGAAVAAVLAAKFRRITLAFTAAWILYGFAAAGPASIASVIWIAVSSWALGRCVFPAIKDHLIAAAAGLASWIVLFSILVRFPVNRPWLWLILTALPIVTASLRRIPFPEWPEAATRDQRFWSSLLMCILTAHFMLALKPEVSADGLSWHLVAPYRISLWGYWPFDVNEFAWAAMPMGGDWLWSLTWLFGDEQGARLMNFAVLALTCGLVASRVGLAAAALWASTPLVMLVTGSLFVENIWAYLLLAAFLLAWEESGQPWAVALLCGAASMCKLMAVPLAVPIVAWSLWKSRCWRPAVLFLAAGTMPYLEEIVRTGNPFFPYFNGIFKSPLYPSEASIKDVRFTQTLSWRSLWDMTFKTSLFYESPGGGFGFQWLALMPATVFAFFRRRDPLIRAALALGAAEIVIVFLGQPYIRYMYAALLLWMLAVGKASESAAWKFLLAAVCCLNMLYFANAGWYHRDFIIEPLSEPKRMARYAAESAPLNPLIAYANNELPNQAIAFISQDGVARLQARAWVNTWHGGFFADDLRKVRTAADARRLLESRQVKYWIGPDGTRPELFSTLAAWELADPGQSAVECRAGDWVLYRLLPSGAPPNRRYSGAGRYDDLVRGSRLIGPWIRDKQFPAAYKGTIMYCDQPACQAEFDFDGSAVTLIFTKAFNRGQAEILIDGAPMATLDAYNHEVLWQQHVRFAAPSAGRHTLTIRVLGKRSPVSQGGFIDIDGFIVE